MAASGWVVKVGDLLHHPGSEDTISFTEKMIHDDSMKILAPGVSGSIHLLALNDTTIQLTIDHLECVVEDISDISGDVFSRDVVLEDYEVLYTIPQEKINTDDVYSSFDDVYDIDPKDLCIDLSNCVVNSIRSQEPIVKRKNDEDMWDCENNDEGSEDTI